MHQWCSVTFFAFNNRQGQGPKFKNILKLNVKLSLVKGFWQNFFIAENAPFHSTYSPKMPDCASSLNELYTAFLPTKIS